MAVLTPRLAKSTIRHAANTTEAPENTIARLFVARGPSRADVQKAFQWVAARKIQLEWMRYTANTDGATKAIARRSVAE